MQKSYAHLTPALLSSRERINRECCSRLFWSAQAIKHSKGIETMIEKDRQPLEDDQYRGTSRATAYPPSDADPTQNVVAPLEGATGTTAYPLSDADPILLVRPEVCQGRLPGNERIRFVFP